MIKVPEGPFSIGSTTWPGVSRVLEELGELGQVLGKLIGSGDVAPQPPRSRPSKAWGRISELAALLAGVPSGGDSDAD